MSQKFAVLLVWMLTIGGGATTIVRLMTNVRSKTVVTVISKISEKPVGKEACLVVIYGLELGKKYNLESATINLGRSSKADIQIDQESVSRNHAKIVNTGKSIILRDLGSTNRTYVNADLIDESVLRDVYL